MSHGLNRKYDSKKEYRFIYIFTEGEKTETNYFKSKKEEIEREITLNYETPLQASIVV